jgi:hypothetical protein
LVSHTLAYATTQLNLIHEVGNVETIDYRVKGTYVLGRVPKAVANRLKQYNVNSEPKLPVATVTDEIDWAALGRGRHSATDNIET